MVGLPYLHTRVQFSSFILESIFKLHHICLPRPKAPRHATYHSLRHEELVGPELLHHPMPVSALVHCILRMIRLAHVVKELPMQLAGVSNSRQLEPQGSIDSGPLGLQPRPEVFDSSSLTSRLEGLSGHSGDLQGSQLMRLRPSMRQCA